MNSPQHPQPGQADRSQSLWTSRWALVVLATLVAFGFQGSRGLYESTEGRYAETARGMLASGNFIEPRLAGEPHLSKPPLTYWATALGLGVWGQHEWGARFGLALALVVAVLCVAGIGTQLWDRHTGWVAGVVYATSLFPVGAANLLSTDTFLNLWVLLAMWGYLAALRAAATQRSRWQLVMWLGLSLGFLTKGPPALLVVLPIWVWNRRQPVPVRWAFFPGWILFGVVGLGWYLWMVAQQPELIRYFLGEEVVGRVADPSFNRNPEWYGALRVFTPALLLGGGLWSLWGLVHAVRVGLHRRLAKIFSAPDSSGLLLLWVVLPLCIFFLARSRLVLYVLPLYAPIALALGRGWVTAGHHRGRAMWAMTLASALLCLASKGVAAHISHRNDMRALHELCGQNLAIAEEIVALDQRELHGLRFYLQGRDLHPVSYEPHPEVPETLATYLAGRGPERPGGFRVIARWQANSRVRKSLKQVGYPYRDRQRDAHWVCYFVPVDSGSAAANP